MNKELAEGIKNLGTVLNDHEVSYMFVGGIAVSCDNTDEKLRTTRSFTEVVARL